MDISETYIKMCETAKKLISKEIIMGLDSNTFWAQLHHDKYMVDIRGCIPEEDIPLFRQDQLQEMVTKGNEKHHLWIMLAEFNRFAHPMDNHSIESMEQLWLAFVMKEKFNKVWTGTRWVKSNP